MKDSELLRKAKRMMELSPANHVDGVCAFIELAAGTICSDQVRNLKRWIITMLGGRAWLRSWLLENGHMTMLEWDLIRDGDAEAQAKLKQTRLNWLDWMIAECEKAEAEK